MAEALDTYSDLDLSDSDCDGDSNRLNTLFKSAANHMQNLVSSLDSSKLLQIYSFYKQATEGPCNIPRPKWYDMQAKQKWDAWNSLGDMSPEAAKEKYVSIITECDPEWNVKNKEKDSNKKSQHWVTVSSLGNNRSEESNDSKTIYDFCRDGDVWQVQTLIKSQPGVLNSLDSEGLGLIHWAADRGCVDVIKILISLKCDVSLKDESGQTALHYAASCGHKECVELLLQEGIDKNVKDCDDKTAADLASDDEILKLLM